MPNGTHKNNQKKKITTTLKKGVFEKISKISSKSRGAWINETQKKWRFHRRKQKHRKQKLATRFQTDGLVGNMTEIWIKITKEPPYTNRHSFVTLGVKFKFFVACLVFEIQDCGHEYFFISLMLFCSWLVWFEFQIHQLIPNKHYKNHIFTVQKFQFEKKIENLHAPW